MRLQDIAGLPSTWLVTCDHPECTAQESLLDDKAACAIAEMVQSSKTLGDILRAVVRARGWVIRYDQPARVGALAAEFCPVHAGVPRG